jgi:phosphatidylglycerophosphate synthase
VGAPAERWSRVHHGIDPARVPLLRPWLAAMWWLARPLVALRVPPTAITVLGALLALDAVLLAARLPLVAFVLVVGSVLCDGLDGAVALNGPGPTEFGRRADAVADRVADCAFAAVLWQCGAPWPLAVLAAVLSLGHELLRSVRGGVAARTITVAERPTRAVCTAAGCVAAAISAAAWPPAVCAGVWVVLAVIGLVQIGRA